MSTIERQKIQKLSAQEKEDILVRILRDLEKNDADGVFHELDTMKQLVNQRYKDMMDDIGKQIKRIESGESEKI